nr:hypothetical protein [Mycoplasmopsis bovis]
MLNKIKATKKKLKSYQRSYCYKSSTLKDKELNLNADLSKKSVTVSAKDFEGEVTLKFEIETNSGKSMMKWMRKSNRIEKNRRKDWKSIVEAAMEWVLETLNEYIENKITNFEILIEVKIIIDKLMNKK